MLKLVQELDPAGIGARDLRECLLLQIERIQEGNITLFTAKKILEDHFEEFTKKHFEKPAPPSLSKDIKIMQRNGKK